ncbi:MAG TPA: CHAT domain-containing protein [Actinomycetota bacterium]|nr:CHAT domain-containing protein [Actinomycetota bacterium]
MTPSRAELRLRSAMAAATKTGDPQAWLTAATALQDFLARRDPDGAGRTQLRHDLLDACEQLRRRWSSRTGRLWVAQQADQVTGPPLRDLLDDADPDPAEVFDLTEAARARALLDALSGCFHGDSGDPGESGQAGRVLAFAPEADPDPLLREMRLISAVRTADDEQAPARREALAAVESMYEIAGTGFRGGAGPAGLAAVQAALHPDEVLVEYVVPNHPLHPAMGLAALVIAADDVRLVPDLRLPDQYTSGFIGSYFIDGRAPVDASPMGDMVVSTRRAVQGDDPAAAFEAGRMLYDVLVGPVLDRAPARCIVVPHRQLHPVPWMALIDPTGTPWLASTTVTVCPSASVWTHLAGRRRTGWSALALGDPLLGYAGMSPLPQAAAEVEHLGEVWHAAGLPADVHTGALANVAALRSAGGASVVHLATHATFPDSATGEDHQLLLSLSAGSSGRVPASLLRTLDFQHAWCLTFSVCNGGLYRIAPGDEPLGLIPAALEAGATSVIAAQWPVDDLAGRQLMSHFVENLPGGDPAAALRTAALTMAGQGAPTRDWATFVATGSGRGSV